MAIELISKIKPKNNGTFAMVDASDVEMPNGKRLSEVEFGGGSLDMEALIAAVKGAVLDENDKIQEQYLPEEWVQRYVEEYIDEALGGEY
jgi:hypothetical protein